MTHAQQASGSGGIYGGNGVEDERDILIQYFDELLSLGLLSPVQHRPLVFSVPKWDGAWNEEILRVAGSALVRLHNSGDAKLFLAEAQAALPDLHTDIAPLGRTMTSMFNEDVATWLAVAFYVLVAAREKPELLDRI